MPSNPDCSFDQLDEGMSAERDYVIDPALYESFLNLFGDNSLVHTSEAFAARNGFRGIVTHGAILNGFQKLRTLIHGVVVGEGDFCIDAKFARGLFCGRSLC